eukprot:6180490-Pleurochrysis_carterae.AAC.2
MKSRVLCCPMQCFEGYDQHAITLVRDSNESLVSITLSAQYAGCPPLPLSRAFSRQCRFSNYMCCQYHPSFSCGFFCSSIQRINITLSNLLRKWAQQELLSIATMHS